MNHSEEIEAAAVVASYVEDLKVSAKSELAGLDDETIQLSVETDRRLPEVGRLWLDPLAGILNDLVIKAESEEITDTDLILAIEQVSAAAPELSEALNTEVLTEALYETMSAAALNGLAVSAKKR